jgi:hypothetical protein
VVAELGGGRRLEMSTPGPYEHDVGVRGLLTTSYEA